MEKKSVNQVFKEFISPDYPDLTFKEWYDYNLKLFKVDTKEGYPGDFVTWLNSRYHEIGPKLKNIMKEQKLNSVGSVLADLGQTATNVGTALGGGQTTVATTEAPKDEPKKVNYVPFIIGGLALVGVTIGIIAIIKGSDGK